jgi:hypothetical protein
MDQDLVVLVVILALVREIWIGNPDTPREGCIVELEGQNGMAMRTKIIAHLDDREISARVRVFHGEKDLHRIVRQTRQEKVCDKFEIWRANLITVDDVDLARKPPVSNLVEVGARIPPLMDRLWVQGAPETGIHSFQAHAETIAFVAKRLVDELIQGRLPAFIGVVQRIGINQPLHIHVGEGAGVLVPAEAGCRKIVELPIPLRAKRFIEVQRLRFFRDDEKGREVPLPVFRRLLLEAPP